MPKDREDLKIHWNHTSNLYSDMCAYLRFMVNDGNIQEPTYNMLIKNVDDLFNQYRDLHQELDHYVPEDDEGDDE